jgi:hypothetical protein
MPASIIRSTKSWSPWREARMRLRFRRRQVWLLLCAGACFAILFHILREEASALRAFGQVIFLAVYAYFAIYRSRA